ncbi:transient receptor potential cation channel subfamily V member 5-like isoform X2 [Oscarella lobularis]
MIKKGKSINGTDPFGQTALHEAARKWGIDVVRFLCDSGADLNHQDLYGRTPLHVAVSCNASDTVKYLVESGADSNVLTYGERQSPLHYAARSDAVESIVILLQAKCYIEARDYRGRTPLQVAADLDRSESVRHLLLDVKPRPADAGVRDNTGQTALSSMVLTMPLVARHALDQLHRKSTVQRKQLFYVNLLEKPLLSQEEDEIDSLLFRESVYSPLEMIVRYKHFQLVNHPVIRQLINIKWKQFGRTGVILQLIIFLTFLAALTTFTVAGDYEKKYDYTPLKDHWWRIFIALIVIALLVYQWVEEIWEFARSRKQHKLWIKWRTREYEKDLTYSHPKYQEEKEYVVQEMERLKKSTPAYFDDKWNYIDWLSYALLLAAIIAHVIDIADHTKTKAAVHARLLCIALIFAWLRVLKFVRAFKSLGPFVVILQHMVADVGRFVFFYIVIYIPYAASFWVFFGGRSVSGFTTVSRALFSLYRITLVDEYSYNEMRAEDSIMADILVGTFLALAAVISLNLFIALMSDSFQRVYDNSKANAVMQRASIILSLEEKLSKKKLDAYRREIHTRHAPSEEFYDDDDQEGDELRKVTVQTHDEILELRRLLDERLDQEDASKERLTRLERDLAEMKEMLRRFTARSL